MDKNKENLWNFVFIFNPYKDLWFAIERERISDFYNGKYPDALSAKDSMDLIKYISTGKAGGEDK